MPVRMAMSRPVMMAATSVTAIIISIRVKPRELIRAGRRPAPRFVLRDIDGISGLQDAASKRLERKAVAGFAVHPKDFELDAVDHPLAGRGSGCGLERLNYGAPSDGGPAGERGVE